MIRTLSWYRLDRHDQPDPDPAPPASNPAPQPTADPTSGQDPNEPVDVSKLPANVQNLISQLRKDAAKNRTDPKTAAEQAKTELAQQIGKALGLVSGDEPPDPAVLTEQIEHFQAAAWRNGVELTVHRMAAQMGADPESLLDSNAFIDSLDDLTEADPRSADFRTALEAKVKAAVERNPRKYAAATAAAVRTPAPDPSQGRGGKNEPVDFRKASKDEVAAELARYGFRRYS
jgi:hypothetical protein